jgi:hypothetical protein
MSAYGALAVANTWASAQTFTSGISTTSITSAVAGSAVSLFNTTTGIITMGTATSTNRIGNLQITGDTIENQTETSAVNFATNSTTGIISLGTLVGRTGNINIGTETCNVNVDGSLFTTTPSTNINTTQVPTTAWVNTYYGKLATTNTWSLAQTFSSGITLGANQFISYGTNTSTPAATSTILGSVYTGTYGAGTSPITDGVDLVLSSITSVPIGVYIATGTSNLSSSTTGCVITQPRIQIRNFTANPISYWATGGVPTFTVALQDERYPLTCSGVLVVSAVSTIQLILHVTSADPGGARAGSDTNKAFQFRLVRIG